METSEYAENIFALFCRYKDSFPDVIASAAENSNDPPSFSQDPAFMNKQPREMPDLSEIDYNPNHTKIQTAIDYVGVASKSFNRGKAFDGLQMLIGQKNGVAGICLDISNDTYYRNIVNLNLDNQSKHNPEYQSSFYIGSVAGDLALYLVTDDDQFMPRYIKNYIIFIFNIALYLYNQNYSSIPGFYTINTNQVFATSLHRIKHPVNFSAVSFQNLFTVLQSAFGILRFKLMYFK